MSILYALWFCINYYWQWLIKNWQEQIDRRCRVWLFAHCIVKFLVLIVLSNTSSVHLLQSSMPKKKKKEKKILSPKPTPTSMHQGDPFVVYLRSNSSPWLSLHFDKCLPIAASSACQLLEKLSTSLQTIMLNKYKASGMSHLIDGFFFIGPPSSKKCLSDHDVHNFENVCQRLEVPL